VAGFVFHVHDPNDAAQADDTRVKAMQHAALTRVHDKNVQRVAVAAKGLRNVPVVAGVEDG